MEQQETGFFDTSLDNTAKAHLLETVRWTKFLSILGFILIGLMLIGAVFFFVAGSSMGAMSGMWSTMGSVGLGILYLALILLYLFPVILLYKFSTHIKNGINTNNQDMINEGFRHQKNLYRFFGIISIIILTFYLLGIIFGGLGTMFG